MRQFVTRATRIIRRIAVGMLWVAFVGFVLLWCWPTGSGTWRLGNGFTMYPRIHDMKFSWGYWGEDHTILGQVIGSYRLGSLAVSNTGTGSLRLNDDKTLRDRRMTFTCRFPYWLPVAICGICPVLHLVRVCRRKRGVSTCVCGYDLRATPQRCPECGADVPLNQAEITTRHGH